MLQIRNKYVQRGNYIYNTRREKKKRRKPKKIFSIIKRERKISQKNDSTIYIIHSYKYKISADDNNQRSFFFSFFFLEGPIYVLKIKSDSYAILHELEKMYKSDTYARRPCNDR